MCARVRQMAQIETHRLISHRPKKKKKKIHIIEQNDPSWKYTYYLVLLYSKMFRIEQKTKESANLQHHLVPKPTV